MFHNLILSNKDFQQLGKKPRLLEVFLVDEEGNRVRKIQTHEFEKYSEKELDKVYSKKYDCTSGEEAPYYLNRRFKMEAMLFVYFANILPQIGNMLKGILVVLAAGFCTWALLGGLFVHPVCTKEIVSSIGNFTRNRSTSLVFLY